MTRHYTLPKVILDLPGFELENILTNERWRDFSHFAHNAPGLDAVAALYEMERRGTLDPVQGDYLALFFRKLVSAWSRALDGDEMSLLRLQAVHKMIFYETFDLQRSHLEYVANLDRTKSGKGTASLARAYEMRRWMSKLSWVVEPVDASERLAPSSAIKLLDQPRVDEDETGLWKMISKRDYIRQNTTLQSLAIRLYIDLLEEGYGITKDYQSLERDLRLAEQHDIEYSPVDENWQVLPVLGGDWLPVKIIAGSWAARKSSPP